MEEVILIPSQYGSVKIADTSSHDINAYTIEVLGAATFTSLTEKGVTSPLTEHGISGSQPIGTIIRAKTKFTEVQLSAGSIVVY